MEQWFVHLKSEKPPRKSGFSIIWRQSSKTKLTSIKLYCHYKLVLQRLQSLHL